MDDKNMSVCGCHQNVTLAENLNANMQITLVSSQITIFITETVMKEYDIDLDL